MNCYFAVPVTSLLHGAKYQKIITIKKKYFRDEQFTDRQISGNMFNCRDTAVVG